LEAEGVARAERQIAAADVILFVADVTAAWDDRLWRSLNNRPALIVHNKCDLAVVPTDGRPAGIAISAVTGVGIQKLCEAIAQRLVPAIPPPGSAVPFTADQVAALRAAQSGLENQNHSVAAAQLMALVACIQSLSG
jgi:tRNA U34 5-carboxymethylaminomethyl modifying GTPase MnmE/TrmE